MNQGMQDIKDYIFGGGILGKPIGNEVVLDDIILGDYNPISRKINTYEPPPHIHNPRALMGYTFFQLIGIITYGRLREYARIKVQEALGTADDEEARQIFIHAYAEYAVYREEFGFATNPKMTSLMQDLFDEEKLKELLD